MAGCAAVILAAHYDSVRADAAQGAVLSVLDGRPPRRGQHLRRLGQPWQRSCCRSILIGLIQNGMRLANIPAEPQALVIGGLLIFSVVIPRLLYSLDERRRHAFVDLKTIALEPFGKRRVGTNKEEQVMQKRLSTILALAALGAAAAVAPTAAQAGYTICFMPKFVGHPVFTQANEGAQAAGKELGDKVIYAGSTEINVARQIEWIETCTKQHVDGIAITALDPNALAPSLKAAAAAGVKVISWDFGRSAGRAQALRLSAFAGKDGRSLRQQIGDAMNYEGEWAWLSTGPNVPTRCCGSRRPKTT